MMIKNLFLWIGVAVVLGWSSGASAVPVTNGLVAAYEFSGNADDVSGNGNDGVVNGATLTADRFGNAGSAYSFDGVNDYVAVPTSLDIQLENGDMTISMWVKLDGSDAQQYDLIDKMVPSGSYANYVSGFILHTLIDAWDPGEAGVTRFCVANQLQGGISCFDSNTNIVDGNYHHLLVTRSALNEVSIYVDGVDDGAVLDHQNSGSVVGAPEEMLFGKRHSDLDFVEGALDDAYLFNRVLDPSEITTLYSAVPEPSTALLLGIGLSALAATRRRPSS